MEEYCNRRNVKHKGMGASHNRSCLGTVKLFNLMAVLHAQGSM